MLARANFGKEHVNEDESQGKAQDQHQPNAMSIPSKQLIKYANTLSTKSLGNFVLMSLQTYNASVRHSVGIPNPPYLTYKFKNVQNYQHT